MKKDKKVKDLNTTQKALPEHKALMQLPQAKDKPAGRLSEGKTAPLTERKK